jgi:RNA polymerase sigma factor (sigma-70 family)
MRMSAEGGPGTLGKLALRCQPDARLVTLTREGSDAAFEEVVGRYQTRLVGFAAGIASRDRAEDVVQESLMRALSSIRETDSEINLRPWLYTIVRNRALNDRRDEPAFEHLDEEYDGVPQPPDIAGRRAELAGVVEQLKALPEAQREALVQRELGGRSHEDIAEEMDTTPGAVRGLIFRARSSLRDFAGLLIPMPLLRAVAGSSAGGAGAATVAATTGGGGGIVKLGATLGMAVVAIGSGVALHDRSNSSGNDAKAEMLPKVAVRSASDSGATAPPTSSAASGEPSTASRASARSATDGPSDADAGTSNEGPGSNSSSHGGSTGPGPASGSSGSSGSGSGTGGGGTVDGGGTGDGGGGGGTPGPGDGGGEHGGILDGGGDGGGHSGPDSGGGGLLDGGDGGGTLDGSGGGDGGTGSGGGGGGTLPPPPDDGSGGLLDGGGGSSGSSGGTSQPLSLSA